MNLRDSSPMTNATHKLALSSIPLKSQFLIGLSLAYDESVGTILGPPWNFKCVGRCCFVQSSEFELERSHTDGAQNTLPLHQPRISGPTSSGNRIESGQDLDAPQSGRRAPFEDRFHPREILAPAIVPRHVRA